MAEAMWRREGRDDGFGWRGRYDQTSVRVSVHAPGLLVQDWPVWRIVLENPFQHGEPSIMALEVRVIDLDMTSAEPPASLRRYADALVTLWEAGLPGEKLEAR